MVSVATPIAILSDLEDVKDGENILKMRRWWEDFEDFERC